MSSFIISNLGADLGNGLRRSGNHANMSERPTDRSCEAISPGHRPIVAEYYILIACYFETKRLHC